MNKMLQNLNLTKKNKKFKLFILKKGENILYYNFN